jgi:hypothetical protein
MSEGNESELWSIALNGMKRFFDEGMTIWKEGQFFSLFPNNNVAQSDYVVSKLKELDVSGSIQFVGDKNIYIKVIKI